MILFFGPENYVIKLPTASYTFGPHKKNFVADFLQQSAISVGKTAVLRF